MQESLCEVSSLNPDSPKLGKTQADIAQRWHHEEEAWHCRAPGGRFIMVGPLNVFHYPEKLDKGLNLNAWDNFLRNINCGE